MTSPGVGFQQAPRKVAWLKRDVLLFNLSIGCGRAEQHFVYELDKDFAVFPTYPLALSKDRDPPDYPMNMLANAAFQDFKQDSQEVIDFYSTQKSVQIPGVPALDPSRLVDGDRSIEIFRPLPVTSAGRDFEFRSTVLGVYDKGKAGTIVKYQDDLVDADTGEIYARIIGCLFYVGQGGWGGPRGPREARCLPPGGRSPDETYSIDVGNESAHLYRLNGDYNPLHATPEPGNAMGFGGIILHGVYAYNLIAHSILERLCGSDPSCFKEMYARFSGVVKPGDRIQVTLWRMGATSDGWEELRWRASVEGTGKVCLQDGRLVLRAKTGSSSKL